MQHLILSIKDHYFAVDVQLIQDVIKGSKTTAVPLSKGNITGILNLRGHIVTEVNVAKTLNIRDAFQEERYIIVIQHQEEFYSLAFDKIGDVIAIDENKIEPLPDNIDDHWRDVARGLYRLPDTLLVILDINLFITKILEVGDSSSAAVAS